MFACLHKEVFKFGTRIKWNDALETIQRKRVVDDGQLKLIDIISVWSLNTPYLAQHFSCYNVFQFLYILQVVITSQFRQFL